MNNIKQIQKILENAELAQVAYGYFHLVGNKLDENVAQSVKEVKDKVCLNFS